MFLFSKIFKYIWPLIRKRKGVFWAIIFLFAIRVFVDYIIVPVYFKRFIDTLSGPGLNRTILSTHVFYLVFWIIVFNFIVTITARSRGFMYLSFMVDMIRNLRNYSFQKIEQNSHTFFANTFAGSLVTKSRRFVNAFEVMFDIFIFNFLQIIILLVGV
ncbi:MAG TPA: hypothetical protein VGO21_01095, partial [Candidatus Paceibacterota bacterium]|nr:hypothetical protein [Candidatus Paceibacterota bacterium]